MSDPADPLYPFLTGKGELAGLIARHDWAATSIGPIEGWPPALRANIAYILRAPMPFVTLWGPDGIMIYNDAYAAFAGTRHPQLLGSKVLEGWDEVADFNAHVMKSVYHEGGTLSYEDQELSLDRAGQGPSVGWMTLDYSPAIDDEGRVIGVICIVVETTAKVRAEQRIAGEGERIRRMFDQAPGFAAILSGPDHVIDSANAAYMQLVGHRPIVGQPLLQALPEVRGQGFVAILDQVYATGEAHSGRQVPLLIQRDPGAEPELAYLDYAYQPIRDEDGAVSGIFVNGYEVTELVQAQERLRIAQEAGHVGSFEFDPVTRRMAITDEFCRLWGIPLTAEITMEQAADAVLEEDRTQLRSMQAELDEDSLGYTEYRIRRADTGEERWIARNGQAVSDPHRDRRRFAGVVYDITERRRIEEQLRILNETLEQRVAQRTAERDRIWRLSTDIMLVADFAGIIHAVNPAWTEMLGWTEQELVGSQLLDLVHDDDIAATSAEMDQLEAGHRTLRFANRYRHKDGDYRWLSWTAVPHADLLHGVGRDITPERDAQRALEQMQEALRQSQKMEAVGQLTGGIAHDFNNLLTVVTGNIDMAGRALDNAGVTEARSRRALANAMKGAERAASLTQRLLAFSRRQPLAPRALDVDRLVQGMSELVARSLGETVRLEIITAPGLWRIEADPNQLENAILNLAVNARDAMPGGGQLVIETANARLDEAYTASQVEVAPGQYVVIAVTDTGEGMSRETMAHVFEPFFTTKEVGRGTGLGLSMVYGFVKQSGGHVKVYSELGVGTTVKIYLPRLMADADIEIEAAPPPDIEVSQRYETILAVEDDDDVRAYTVESLRDLGYRVLEAHDGPSALRLLERQEEPIDLLFTDVVMPGMSGSELAEAARKLQPRLRVLYTSGYTRDAISHGGRLDAGVEMIAKPFTYAALGRKIRDQLDAGRTGRVLVVAARPVERLQAVEFLQGAGFATEQAATVAEALGKVRSAQGRYDMVFIDQQLSDRRGETLLVEVRALHADLPLLLACEEDESDIRAKLSGDVCVAVLPKPYTPEQLAAALRDLHAHCLGARGWT
ncbi:PAS domain S-box protein [Sphingomonas naphthae]|uniref:histidine kinase n=1 Tax=Sphingomonas naphthae TaxID=1813468 RepID=A0ABY7TPF4_9SPHN|nr:PAS domain S-box protein [Sphingomonas naphthae]WCT74805.1 PAS domain S-box protein [Sphingomonas naphthae]